jgi:hypothetical protein
MFVHNPTAAPISCYAVRKTKTLKQGAEVPAYISEAVAKASAAGDWGAVAMLAKSAGGDASSKVVGKTIVFVSPGETIEIPVEHEEQVRKDLAHKKMTDRLGQRLLVEVADPSIVPPENRNPRLREVAMGVVSGDKRELGTYGEGGRLIPPQGRQVAQTEIERGPVDTGKNHPKRER